MPGKDATSVDSDQITQDVISELSLSGCSELGKQVSVVTNASVSPFDTFGRPTLDLTQETICGLK
jgi:hypothetical protein